VEREHAYACAGEFDHLRSGIGNLREVMTQEQLGFKEPFIY
jgi:hypothetical protein